ncbi:MAG: Hpt domain-containing protein [Bdellovibrionota bacterium]
MKTINLEILKTLQGPYVGDLIDTFLESTRSQLRELEKAAEQGNFDDVHRIAHDIESGARVIGAERLADVCHTIDEDFTVGPIDPSKQSLLEGLKREFVILRRVLEPTEMHLWGRQ